MWILFARDIYAVPQPVVPASLTFVGIGTLILVVALGAIPGRLAARRSPAIVLRCE